MTSSAEKSPRPVARLRANAAESPRPSISFRMRADVHDRLRSSAADNGFSLSEEIESRLNNSLQMQDHIATLERHIAAQEQHIATAKAFDLLLWPDDDARALGRVFAVALGAVRNASGKSWRDDTAAPVILAGVMRRAMDRCSRTESFVAEFLDRERIASTAESIAASLAGFIDETMPALPPLQPQDDPANWTTRAYDAVTFRDKATGNLLQVVAGPEYDITDPEAARGFGLDYRAAVDRFRPIRDAVDAESFIVFPLKNGSTAWQSLERGGAKVHVPAGQDVPPAPSRSLPAFDADGLRHETPGVDAVYEPARGQIPTSISARAMWDDVKSPARDGETPFEVDDPQGPAFRLTGHAEAMRLMGHLPRNPAVLPPELGDKAEFDRAVASERSDEAPGDSEPRAQPAPKHRGRAKAKAKATA